MSPGLEKKNSKIFLLKIWSNIITLICFVIPFYLLINYILSSPKIFLKKEHRFTIQKCIENILYDGYTIITYRYFLFYLIVTFFSVHQFILTFILTFFSFL